MRSCRKNGNSKCSCWLAFNTEKCLFFLPLLWLSAKLLQSASDHAPNKYTKFSLQQIITRKTPLALLCLWCSCDLDISQLSHTNCYHHAKLDRFSCMVLEGKKSIDNLATQSARWGPEKYPSFHWLAKLFRPRQENISEVQHQSAWKEEPHQSKQLTCAFAHNAMLIPYQNKPQLQAIPQYFNKMSVLSHFDP